MTVSSGFNYSSQFSFERDFDHDAFLVWIDKNWTHSFWYAGIYISFVFFGRRYMEHREKYELRTPLILWSTFLGLFSILGAARTIPEMVYIIRKYGFEYSVCNPSYFYGPTAFWAFTFVISKVYELGDTVFIVLRKQPLIFLHWYHHISVLIYVWYSYTDHTGPGRWFMVMNYTVHSCMYSYYAFRAMRLPIPKPINMTITILQISQMCGGIIVNITSYRVKSRGDYCQQSLENMRYSLMMYLSYFLLFIYFFHKAYVKPKPIKSNVKPAAMAMPMVTSPTNKFEKSECNGNSINAINTKDTAMSNNHDNYANGEPVNMKKFQ